MKLYINILVCVYLVTFCSCNSDGGFYGDSKIPLSTQIEEELSNNVELIFNDDTLLTHDVLNEFYIQNDFEPIWINDSSLNKNGKDMLNLVENAYNYGLLPSFYSHKAILSNKDSALVKAEVLLTNAFVLYSTHLSVGFLDTISMSYAWKKDSVEFDYLTALKEIEGTSNVQKLLESYQPKNWEYVQLQTGLEKFVSEYSLNNADSIKIPAYKEDSTLCYESAKKALIAHGFLDKTNSNDSIFIDNLKAFQLINGLKDDAIVGKWTGKTLESSNQDRFFKAMLSLEKWRWKKDTEFPSRYIRVNIPGYTLKLWDKNKVVSQHRVIVGADATRTPEFHAKLQRIISNPFWHLPYSIASTEVLYGIKKDSAYFRKKGMKIFRDGAEVDPYAVDWTEVKQTNFRYRVRQDGGGSNSLGRMKFLFPNEHAVYIHDTPAKGLFMNDVRAYSHGCVRLHQPFDLAKSILELDEHLIVSDTLDSLIKRGTQRVMELSNPFEVYIEYYTAIGDSVGNITFYPDVYNRDEKYLADIKRRFEF
jgi:murein L,D-transpeptidase YcbB/YkuD